VQRLVTSGWFGIQPPVGTKFSLPHTRADWPCGPNAVLYNGYRLPFPGVRQPEREVDRPLPSSADVKEIVELYL